MADRKQKKQQQQLKYKKEKQQKAAEQYRNQFMPLVKFLKKEGLPFKYARVGQNRIEYFRFDDFNKFTEASQEKIQKNASIKQLFSKTQIKEEFIFLKRPSDSKNLKYPHVLQPAASTDPEAKFCSFKFDTTISRKTYMFGIILAVLALVLFPVWPYQLKYAIWLISLYLLIFLVGLLAFRLAIYVICVVAGFNVWIFPNLLGQYGFIESFKPIFYAERWEKSKINIAIRIAVFSVLTFYGVQLYLDPEFLEDHFTVTKSTIDDIHDWGVAKIKNEVQFSQKAITSIHDLEKQEKQINSTLTNQTDQVNGFEEYTEFVNEA